MSETTVKTVFKSLMENIKKSKYALAPLHEAIANSLEAIFQKDNFAANEKPEINITFDFSGLLDEKKTLSQITVQDNGLGFDSQNYSRFETLLDKTKGYNNRGSGRIQFVHRFDRLDVASYYVEGGQHFKRNFSCSATRFVYDHKNVVDPERHRSGSTITFLAGETLDRERAYFDALEIEDIVRDLKRQFMLRYYLESKKEKGKAPTIKVIFQKNGKPVSSASITPADMPAPADVGSITVQYHQLRNVNDPTNIDWVIVPEKEEALEWAHFKLSENALASNGVWLCSKGVTVAPIHYEGISKQDTINGKRYLTAFYGAALDEPNNVSDSVDSFQFPDQKAVESKIRDGDLYLPGEQFLFFDDIKKGINEAIPGIYKDVLDVQKDKDNRVDEIARQNGISLQIARRANIRLNDTAAKITEKLFKEQADYLSKESLKIQKVFGELNTLNPTSDTYQQELETKSAELLKLIPQQNREELGRYIIRRDMVAEVLRKILAQELTYQTATTTGTKKDREGLIHDLIFKRKSGDAEQLNDLWVLNEEYVHFSGCSDLPINKIVDENGDSLLRPITDAEIAELGVKPAMRPDIFLYPEEGKCVLVELKAPDVDLADHLNQMTKYCNLIANYSVRKIQKFYCYLIGETFNPLTDLDGEYQETVKGDWVRNNIRIVSFQDRSTIADAQIEISKLSSIYGRAHRRNKSFADKLGLRELLDFKHDTAATPDSGKRCV